MSSTQKEGLRLPRQGGSLGTGPGKMCERRRPPLPLQDFITSRKNFQLSFSSLPSQQPVVGPDSAQAGFQVGTAPPEWPHGTSPSFQLCCHAQHIVLAHLITKDGRTFQEEAGEGELGRQGALLTASPFYSGRKAQTSMGASHCGFQPQEARFLFQGGERRR